MKKISSIAAIVVTALFTACGNGATDDNKRDSKDTTTTSSTVADIHLVPTPPGPEFPGASLTVNELKGKPLEGTDSVEVSIVYGVKNYELKTQTSDAADRTCNNSKDGQHIHFILDNGPYTALYEPKHTFKVAKNSEHVLLSFLSRSYHLSLKNKEAYQLISFKVDDKGNIQKSENKKAPMLFYSRPKGAYIGNDVKDVLLDFYLVGSDLDKDSLKVIAQINDSKSFDITKWEPYILNGLPMGKNTITLSLVKKDGTALEEGPYTRVSREFTLAEKEPIN